MTSTTVSTELRQVLRRLRLSPILDTLPERLILAQQQHLPHQDFLELILADESARRDRMSATLRARSAHLDPTMTLEAWDDTAEVTFDRQLWGELTTLRFVEACNNVLILGPVGVGKTMLATALGHIACRRRISVISERADRLFKRLKAARSTTRMRPRCAGWRTWTSCCWTTSPSSRMTAWRPVTSTSSSWNGIAARRP